MGLSYGEWVLVFSAGAVQIFTGLLLGMSLAGLQLHRRIVGLAVAALLFGGLYAFAGLFFPAPFLLVLITLLTVPVILLLKKAPLMQILTAVLLSLLFHYLFITLIEHNLFELLLNLKAVSEDAGTNVSIQLFVMLNNVFILFIVWSRKPALFPEKFFQQPTLEGEDDMSFGGLPYTVVVLLTLLSAGLYLTIAELEFLRPLYRLFITLWSVVITVAVLYFQRRIIYHKNEKIQLFLDQQYQKELLSFFRMIRSQRHDFNFHLSAIYGLIQRKAYDECKAYIENMVSSATEINDLLPLQEPAVAAMLSTFKERALTKRIGVDYLILNDMRNNPMSVYETNKVLGNLMQNAMDATERMPDADRHISAEISKERNQITISVSNRAELNENELKDIFRTGFSTKSSHEGIGLPVVKRIVERYGGAVYPEWQAGILTMRVFIPEKTG